MRIAAAQIRPQKGSVLENIEFPYFVCGNEQMIFTMDNVKIAPAICYESFQIEHVDHASELGAEVYITSVAKSQNGINKAWSHYQYVARKYSMTVLMANCIGHCDNFESVGKSAVWSNEGILVGELDDTNEGIIVYDTTTQEITKKILS
ncbi:nitrilase-related carbon-nitrogen hydrolase [Paenibacillus elgii]